MKNKALLTITCLCLFCLSVDAQKPSKTKKKSNTETVATGAQDRAMWVKYLYKISYPVIHNLSEGTLCANMPVEKNATYGGNAKEVTYLEAVGRTLAGVAPWLALPDDETEEGVLRKKVRKEVLQGLTKAIDPLQPDYLNFKKQYQPIVDAAYLAHAFLRAPKALWEPLDDVTKQRYVEAFKSLRDRGTAYNNWVLFSGITEAFLTRIGEQGDPSRINFARYKIREWYVGDGWYSDGPKFSMDYYNDYVIHPMMVDMLKALLEVKKVGQGEYDQALKRMVRHCEFSERMITPDGMYPVFGRSATYRTAAFQSLGQVALMEQLPSYILPAQVRCALTLVFHNMYEGDQNFDSNGWLLLGFNGHQPEMADSYTSTGSLYMATLGFLPLGLPANHPFWTDAPANWTTKKAWAGEKIRKDYKVEY